MKVKLRWLAWTVCVLSVLVLGGGTASGSIQTTCSGALCVTVEDVDGVSPSVLGPPSVVAYQVYKITVSNTGTTQLPAGTITINLSDIVSESAVTSNAEFTSVGSTTGCARVAQTPANVVRCPVGALAGGTSSATFLVSYRTTRNASATSTNADITVALGSASVSTSEQTGLEPDPEAASSWSPPGRSTQIGTSPTFDNEFSTLQYAVPANRPGFVSGLEEAAGGNVCPAGFFCLGETITTDLGGAAAGTFSPSNLFHLTLNISLSILPPSAPLSSIFLWHRLNNGTLEKIKTRCASVPPTSTSALPCIAVTVDQTAGRLIIDAWGYQNGGWVPGF
jgi:hypothetical protein